ncbi:hypothetical protein [Lapidilactobacillus gannanensis]|uniref:Transposase n=2 Tax=Lapidilactobacillus gannanensis TaxID=2486002 RepID=A0ABW4BMD3_9LACO|nr:hypothetical protein [Lapidilactobacillus gannanensis]
MMQANIEGMTEALNLIRGQAKNYHRKSELRVIRELETKLATLISKRKAEQKKPHPAATRQGNHIKGI